jgi:hypothetical protein
MAEDWTVGAEVDWSTLDGARLWMRLVRREDGRADIVVVVDGGYLPHEETEFAEALSKDLRIPLRSE